MEKTNKEKLCDLCSSEVCTCRTCKGKLPNKFNCDLTLGVCHYLPSTNCAGFNLKPDVVDKTKIN